MINKSGLHLIIAELSFNVIPFHVRLSLLSSLAISFCLIQRWNVQRASLIMRRFDLRLNWVKKLRLNTCHLQLTNASPLLVSFEDSLSSRIINSFFKVNGKCHFECCQKRQFVICYALLLRIKANVEKEESFTACVWKLLPAAFTSTSFSLFLYPFNGSETQTGVHLSLSADILAMLFGFKPTWPCTS